ncbi:MAG: FixH family protein [Gammaproteobacteria bacterium]|nr:FixH family protein [Gammaproteobacteria bacterium]
MSEKLISQSNTKALRNPWVIGWLSLVAIVLIVNIVFITLAYTTNPGLVTDDYYERGRDHEQNIRKKMEARNALGWTYSADFPTSPKINQKELYRVNLADKKGTPLDNSQVKFTAYRPSDASADFTLDMVETLPGLYEINALFPLKGLWEITISISRGDDYYDFSRRASVATD